ncbi:MAG: DegT/DnrJ/EryC1/StrS family aminotransferase [Spirulina sp. SIO3F2]|nr:DegT/DnrJ/EryC1/StrS family aminotransferase [Spirulina sp. SIO3F2]
MPKIPYVNLAAQWTAERQELLPIVEQVLASGQYIGGNIIQEFEVQAAKACQTKYCVALNSGTDALVCGLLALGVQADDEVITPPNSFIASTAAIVHLRAKPIFVDVLPDQNIDPAKIEAAITSRTKAIMPVHLTGRMGRMDEIRAIAERHDIPLIEDAAQSMGSRYQDIPSGKWGEVGCFSAHPLKNLNACGDAGFLTTDSDEIAQRVRLMRNHGLIDRNTVERFGYVSRMDALQAAILSYRLTELDGVIEKRQRNATLYRELIHQEHIFIPEDRGQEFNTYHTFVIQTRQRDELKAYLLSQGIETAIHYPIPIHLQPAANYLGYSRGSFPVTEEQATQILTLPVHQYLEPQEIECIAQHVNTFFA